MRKGSSSPKLSASIRSQMQSWGMPIAQACHLEPKCWAVPWGTLPPPPAKKLQAIYNMVESSRASISCPSPLPLTSRPCI